MNSTPAVSREEVPYEDLDLSQRKNFNYRKITRILSKHGFRCFREPNSTRGVDFVAVRDSGETLRVNLKARWMIDKRYLESGLHIVFPSVDGDHGGCYMLPHDELVDLIGEHCEYLNSPSWRVRGRYSGSTTLKMRRMLQNYYLS